MHKILLIDDDEDEFDLLKSAMQEISWKAEIRYSNFCEDDIRAILASYMPDLIFLDINLPKVNGIECLRTIRELKDYSGIPIIMYSTSADASNIEESYKSGADRYFTKPASFGALCNSLNKIREIEWIKDGKISLAGFII